MPCLAACIDTRHTVRENRMALTTRSRDRLCRCAMHQHRSGTYWTNNTNSFVRPEGLNAIPGSPKRTRLFYLTTHKAACGLAGLIPRMSSMQVTVAPPARLDFTPTRWSR